MMKQIHNGKMRLGPGGIGCPCCVPFGKKTKKKLRKYTRRKAKQTLNKLIKES